MFKTKLTFEKLYGHFKTVIKHKLEVARACFKAGLYWQGIMHDMSKFSPVEFLVSAKYYQGGKSSPIYPERYNKGYSEAEQHHHGHNPHHWEYWININFNGTPIKIPPKYVREIVCDHIGAGKVYKKGEWTPKMPLEHLQSALEKNIWLFHPATEELLVRIETDFSIIGYKAIKKENVDKILEELNYNNLPACNYYGKNIADLELDFRKK